MFSQLAVILPNGMITEHRSGAVGAMLTFQCDTGYLPQDGISICLSNTSWVPIPYCKGIIVFIVNQEGVDMIIKCYDVLCI